MGREQAFSVGTLVWAKVDPYPWWPGRIVKALTQQRQQVFKIAFFADPTYTYLHQHQIMHFQAFDAAPNDDLDHYPVLQKALAMAKAHQSKQPALDDPHLPLPLTETPSSESLPSKTEEIAQQNSMVSEPREAAVVDTEGLEVQFLPDESATEEVTPQNVIRLLQRLRRKKVKPEYCYQKRKEQVRYNDKLREQLLSRYNLSELNPKQKKQQKDSSAQNIQITAPSDPYFPQKKSKKINKCNPKRSIIEEHIEMLSRRCARKIHSMLKESSNSQEQSRMQSMELTKRMLLLADNNNMKLKSLFVTLVRTVGTGRAGCSEQLCDFRQYLQRLEGQKGEDEEGSKITQIQANLN